MKKILMPYFPIMGASTYPDSAELFSNLEQVALGGQQYWLCDYAGTKDLETGKHRYSDYQTAKNKSKSRSWMKFWRKNKNVAF